MPQPGDQQPTIDIAAYIRDAFSHEGAEVAGPGSTPDTVTIKTPGASMQGATGGFGAGLAGGLMTLGARAAMALPKYSEVNIKNMLSDAGVQDPDSVKVQLGTPDKPVNENPLGLVDRIKMALAGRDQAADEQGKRVGAPINQLNYLKDTVGADHAAFNPRTGQLIVRQGNGFYRADDQGTVANMIADAPVAASAVAGSVAGGTLGPAGAIAGGTLGTALGRIGTIEAAHAAGLRDVVDYDQAAKELGKEMLWTTAFGAAPYALTAKEGLIGLNATADALQGLNKMKMSPDVRAQFPKIISKISGDNARDVAVMMNEPSEWKAGQRLLIRWNNREIASAGTGELQIAGETGQATTIDPVTRRLINNVQDVVESGKQQMTKEYGEFNSQPAVRRVLGKARVDLSNLVQDVNGEPVDLIQQMRDLHAQIGDSTPSESRVLGKVIREYESATGRGGPSSYDYTTGKMTAQTGDNVPFAKANEMKAYVDNVIRGQGGSNPEIQVSSRTNRALVMYRDALRNELTNGAKKVDPAIGDAWSANETLYANRRAKYDALGDKNAFEPGNIMTTMKKLGGDKNSQLRENLVSFLQDAKKERLNDTMKQIDVGVSVLNTNSWFDNKTLTGAARTFAGRAAARAAGGASRITSGAIGMLQRQGQVSAWLSQMSQSARTALMRDPQAVNALMQMFAQSVQVENQTRDQLTSQALQATQPLVAPIQQQGNGQ